MIARFPQAGVHLCTQVGRLAGAYWSLDVVNITLGLVSLLTRP